MVKDVSRLLYAFTFKVFRHCQAGKALHSLQNDGSKAYSCVRNDSITLSEIATCTYMYYEKQRSLRLSTNNLASMVINFKEFPSIWASKFFLPSNCIVS